MQNNTAASVTSRGGVLLLPRAAARSALILLACLGGLHLLVSFTPVLSPWVHWLTGDRWDEPPAETVLVVLGADADNAGGTMGHSTYWRCVYVVDVWRKARFKTIILSGDEATVKTMADYLGSHGIPRSSILLETQSFTTHENAVNSSRMLPAGNAPVAILSSDIHMRRAYGCFRKLGLRPLCIPAPDAGKRLNSRLARWSVFIELCLESVKLARYKILGYA